MILSRCRSYADALRTLNSLQRSTISNSDPTHSALNARDKMKILLKHLDLDVKMNLVKYIHVAGTKGKGTTCLYTENLIQAHQEACGKPAKLGCLTSPHVMSVRERIRIDARPISERCFARHFWHLWDQTQSQPSATLPRLLYPGFITLLAFSTFIAERVDVAIIETGVGGETDSTNVIESPIATGITELGLDHVDRLGDTLESIAWHKSGIFKAETPAYSVPQHDSAALILRERAMERSTQIKFINVKHLTDSGIRISPNARFQRHNAALALALANEYVASLDPPGKIEPEVAKCMESTELPAKFEIIPREHITWVLTSSHNHMSVAQASETFAQLVKDLIGKMNRDVLIIFGHDARRDWKQLLATIHEHVKHPVRAAIFCPLIFGSETAGKQDFRNHSTQEICITQSRIWQDLRRGEGSVIVATSVKDAINRVHETKEPSVVFVVGSTYLAGMARHILLNL